MDYYLTLNNETIGPFKKEDIIERLKLGEFSYDSYCWKEGWDEWQPIRSHFPPLPPPFNSGNPPKTTTDANKTTTHNTHQNKANVVGADWEAAVAGAKTKKTETQPTLLEIPQVENADVVKTTRKQRPVILWGGALLILLYIASPYYSLFSLIQSLNEGDTVTLKKTVDFPALRESLKDEMKSKLVQQTKRSISSKEEELADKLVSGMGAMFGPAIIDGLVDTFVTPSGLAGLISNPSSKLDGKKTKNDNKIPIISRLFYSGFSGLTEFQCRLFEDDEILTLHFRLIGLRWMLYAITWRTDTLRSPFK